jgi:hypothetical protein
MFKCSGGNDQVSVSVGMSACSTSNPKIGCTIQDFASDRIDPHVVAQGIKCFQLG